MPIKTKRHEEILEVFMCSNCLLQQQQQIIKLRIQIISLHRKYGESFVTIMFPCLK